MWCQAQRAHVLTQTSLKWIGWHFLQRYSSVATMNKADLIWQNQTYATTWTLFIVTAVHYMDLSADILALIYLKEYSRIVNLTCYSAHKNCTVLVACWLLWNRFLLYNALTNCTLLQIIVLFYNKLICFTHCFTHFR